MKDLSRKITERYELRRVLHMTDLSNLDSILTAKAIFSNNLVKQKNISFVDISNESVQCSRANIIVPCTGLPLHDYVPLYWGQKTPMVSALRDRNETLLFLMFSTELLSECDCVISDGNARSTKTNFKAFSSIDDLDILDPKSINTNKYAFDEEVKRRKQSELLVKDKLPLSYLQYIVCYSSVVKNKVYALLTTHGVQCSVYIGTNNYYY